MDLFSILIANNPISVALQTTASIANVFTSGGDATTTVPGFALSFDVLDLQPGALFEGFEGINPSMAFDFDFLVEQVIEALDFDTFIENIIDNSRELLVDLADGLTDIINDMGSDLLGLLGSISEALNPFNFMVNMIDAAIDNKVEFSYV